jgi:NADH-quinone oxidoreductase subunit M
MFPLLSITLLLPVIGALAMLFYRRIRPSTAHWIGIGTSGLTLLGTVLMWARGINPRGFSQVEQLNWIPSLGATYRVGIDGISLPLVVLTALLFFAVFIFSAKLKDRPAAYVGWFLFLEAACLGTFMALDMLLFYVFFELRLVGMYFVITGWGYEQRRRAGLMFFLYTLLGSLPLLLAIIALYLGAAPHSFDMRTIIANPPLIGGIGMFAAIAILISFGIKTPVVPVHSWLPEAHVQAPTAGSVILAGVMLKIGTYGFIRFGLQMTPGGFRTLAPIIVIIGVVSAVYGAFAALGQTDLKRLVAYTSINHMGYIVIAIGAAAATSNGTLRTLLLDGAVLQMVSHGLVTGTLFFYVGMIQARTGTREIGKLGGLYTLAPTLSAGIMLAMFASLGLPGLAHFPAEFQIFLGTFQVYPWAVVIAIGALVITAALYLRAISTAVMGKPKLKLLSRGELSWNENVAIIPLLVLIVLLGIAPSIVVSVIHVTTRSMGY